MKVARKQMKAERKAEVAANSVQLFKEEVSTANKAKPHRLDNTKSQRQEWWANLTSEQQSERIDYWENNRKANNPKPVFKKKPSLTASEIESLIGEPLTEPFEYAEEWGITVKIIINRDMAKYIKLV